MGVAISRYTELSSNELLTRFCSAEVICPNEPFWNQLLAFNITPPASAEEQLMFDASTEALLQKFLQNNLQTGNLGSLVQVFITRATELLAMPNSDNVMLAWQTFNALFVIRAVTKYLVEMVPEYELCRHLDIQVERRSNGHLEANSSPTPSSTPEGESPPARAQSPRGAGDSRVEMLIDALIGIIIDVPVTDNTYYLHLECINTMLVLMSVYVFSAVHGQTRLIETSHIFRTIYQGRYNMHAPLLVKTLINNLSCMVPAPQQMFGTGAQSGSVLIDIATGLWSMLTFSTPARQTIYTHPPVDRHELLARLKSEHPVANQSCLLLLALANHCMSEKLYREALHSAQDKEAPTTSHQRDSDESDTQVSPPRIDMAALHRALCATAGCEHSTLLLYLMLHSCKAYKTYVTNVDHIENLIVPILQVLYNAPDSNSHHIYMSLIVLLVLTEDDQLIKRVHQVLLRNLPWYQERSISEISLGGLMVLVVVRALQYNMVRVRDKYLHTNCLAAIANMSCEFRNLHPYVAQRLISLFETLTKRRARLCSEIEGGDINNLELPHQSEEKTEEIMDHISVLDEVLRMLLEIINSCLTHQLQNNLNLVYALLHKRQLFQQHQHHPITQNIEMVIGYFSTRLQRMQEHAGGDLGVSEVLAVIKKGAEQWSSDRLKLHRALCATAGCEHSTLLLYLMLHSCKAYKTYVTNVDHIENLIVPILQVLYNAPDSNSHHIYMSLIVLLVLTEDDQLIKRVHQVMLRNLPWYQERSISEISLGGLMVLVVVRALQYNMVRVRDKYLHTNCLAAIANMSCEFRNLHPYVAQRLISLFETLTKRRARLCSEIEGGDINNLELPHQSEEKTEEIMDHISVLDEVLRMLLEIINSCLTHQLQNNLNLVYALLHKRQLFQQHQHHPITQNIEMVIGYFSTRLQRMQEHAGGDLGVSEVLAVIKKGAEQWSSDRLKKFPDLKFRYVEEERPEEFFTPYVWGLITSCGNVHWASEGGARAVSQLLAC